MDALDPSRIQRIVLLIDLHPLLVIENANPYVSGVLAAARRILSFPAISSSLATFKFFFSSMSPILSTSKLRLLFGKSPAFLSFDNPLQTIDSLLGTLNSLSSMQFLLNSTAQPACSRASFVAGSLLQLEHDYAWEPQFQGRKGTPQCLTIRSNLVVLFSPIPQSPSCLSEYLSEGALMSSDQFLGKFFKVFGAIKQRFISKDIHIGWVDVCSDRYFQEERLGSGLFERFVKELGWQCCRADIIVLGSAIVPFGLIFPRIGCTVDYKSLSSFRKDRAELILGIQDSNGATLECKSCDLEVIFLEVLEERSNLRWRSPEISRRGSSKICIRGICEMNAVTKTFVNSCALVLLHGKSRELKKKAVASAREDFIAGKVLKLLCDNQDEVDLSNPIWELILNFLYRKNCSALVSVLDDDGSSFNGVLQPFTLNYALLGIFSKKFDISVCVHNGANDTKRKENKTLTNLFHDYSWCSFINIMFCQSNAFPSAVHLEELYFSLPSIGSKKLRFLKCWMKQITKLNISFDRERKESDNSLSEKEEKSSFQQKSKHCSCTSDNCLNQSACVSTLSFVGFEDSNGFLGSISQKIEHALSAKEIDLLAFAERLVFMSIDAFYAKYRRDLAEGLNPSDEMDLLNSKIATEVSNLLLVRPKDLELKCRRSISLSSTTETTPVVYSNDEKIRMHELQILFRMELLLSKLASNYDKSMKQKLIKDCCLLLQNVEFYLLADFLAGESLLNYATRTLKSRYEHSLQDVIHEIFAEMEFFSFNGNDEKEASDPLPASTDNSGQRNGDSFGKNEHSVPTQHALDSVMEQQLMEAQERRNRARRFSSFTSWIPDLQRVWALKHSTSERRALEPLPRVKSKKRKRRSMSHERVCETP